MDSLEKKNFHILQRLREIRAEQSCQHIDNQIKIWLQLSQPQALVEDGQQATQTQVQQQQQQQQQLQQQLQQQNQLQQQQQQGREKNNTSDEKTIGCFLSNLKHLEGLDSDATESTSSDDSYDELEGFSHEEIPPKRIINSHLLNKHPHKTSNQNQQSLCQRRASHHQQNLSFNLEATTSTNAINGDSHLSDLKAKAIWKWATERSRLASRWTWLQAQIADLEFRVRGQNDALMLAKAYKTPPLPPVLPENSCSRTIPLSKDFRRRRLIKSTQILSDSSKRSVKFSNAPCICASLPQIVAPCLSCNGRYNYVKQLEGENAPLLERVSLADPGCHPVLSFPDDITLGSQISYLLKQETINRKPTKGRPGRKKGSTAANLAAAAASANDIKSGKTVGKKGKYYTGMVGRPPGSQAGLKNPSQTMIASNKLRRKYRKHSTNPNSNNFDSNNLFASNYLNHNSTKRKKRIRSASSMNESSMCSESSNPYRPNHFSSNQTARNVTRRRRSEQSAYDIDNIVIPFSVAATTRVEILEYKEIMTPSWRVWENGTCTSENNVEEEIEDTSDEAYILRHTKGENEEKKRFSLKPPPPPPPKSESTVL